MRKNAKLKEKQKRSEEKIHLDNARKLRGIYFIDPEDKEFKETIKNARKKLETSVAPAMPCKILKNCGSRYDKNTTKLACILKASESTRMRMGNSEPHNHEDHIAGKGENALQHYNLVHKFIPMPQAMKIPAAKAAVDKEWEKLEKISAWNLTKVKGKKQVIDEARTAGATVHFASLMDICHLKNAELEAKHQKYKGRVVLRGDIVKDDSGSYAVFTEQRSSASQMTAAKIMDIISRLPGCDGQAAGAVSANTSTCTTRVPGWSSVVPVLAALLCLLCFHSGFSTLVISGVLRCLLTFLGPSSVCERDVQEEPQQVSQSSAEGRLSHVAGQHDCGILTA